MSSYQRLYVYLTKKNHSYGEEKKRLTFTEGVSCVSEFSDMGKSSGLGKMAS